MVSPGDQVTVKVRMSDPSSKKLHLTMLDDEALAEEMAANNKPSSYGDDDEDRIPLTDIEIDDELWGELKRVTDFGAYIEVGAEVDGFLHFMDHPEWTDGMHPSEFMKKGQRVRVWVADLDNSNRRIRLTANRPRDLNGPRFEKF
jgi:small subunit ribosomal protein S1